MSSLNQSTHLLQPCNLCHGKENTQTITTSGSRFIHPITYEAAVEVASNLRPEDRREVVDGYGVDPIDAIPKEAMKGFCIYFTVPDGRTAGLAGIGDNGAVWMLCTPAIHDFPVLFARQAKRFIDSRTEKLLWNYVDKRNTAHLRLLKYLGFTFVKEVDYGPKQLPFILFNRWIQ